MALHEVGRHYELARQKWRSSGLTDEHARLLKLSALAPSETAALGENFRAEFSLKIPYFDLEGKPTDFFRVRYLTTTGFRSAVDKPLRYMQPRVQSEVYLPPISSTRWGAVLDDSSVPLFITGGELKAACAGINGYFTIGLGGAWNWKSSKRGQSFLPMLEAANWKQRLVTIIFDSDAATNTHVMSAQVRLAKELLNHGAVPYIAAIPALEDGNKLGLDDLIIQRGKDGFEEIVRNAVLVDEGGELWEMNSEVAYVFKPGIVVRLSDGYKMSPRIFTDSAYANRHYDEKKGTKTGMASVRRPLARRWLEWEHRFELSQITYSPGKPRVTDNMLNVWPGWGVEPKSGDIEPWQNILDFLFKDEHEATKQWFEAWCAY